MMIWDNLKDIPAEIDGNVIYNILDADTTAFSLSEDHCYPEIVSGVSVFCDDRNEAIAYAKNLVFKKIPYEFYRSWISVEEVVFSIDEDGEADVNPADVIFDG